MDERDAFLDIIRLETFKIERAAREVPQGRLTDDSFVQEPLIMDPCEAAIAPAAEIRMVVVPVTVAVAVYHVQDERCESTVYTLGAVMVLV